MRRVNSYKSAASAGFNPRSAMTCRASSLVVIGPGASRKASSFAHVDLAPQRPVRRSRDLLPDAFDIVIWIENPNRGWCLRFGPNLGCRSGFRGIG